MSEEKYAIGIDIGGTTTKFGIVSKEGKILNQSRCSTNDYESIDDYVQEIYNCLKPMIDEVGGSQNIVGIGVGAPSGNLYSGTIEHAPNLKWKGIVPMAKLIEDKFNITTKLTNDANAAAMGEMKYGVAKGCNHFITITLGTGVGSGVVVDGKIVVGHDGFAGELGHIIVRPGGRLHKGTGSKGCLESYTSATGVRDTAIEMITNNPEQDTLLKNYSINELNSHAVYECAKKGDKVANQIFEFTGQILGEALANFVMFTSPEMIVLFGGLTKAGSLIMNPTKKHMEDNLLSIFQNKVKLVFSSLPESDAAILGASALVL